jgi:hypothetical protein
MKIYIVEARQEIEAPSMLMAIEHMRDRLCNTNHVYRGAKCKYETIKMKAKTKGLVG